MGPDNGKMIDDCFGKLNADFFRDLLVNKMSLTQIGQAQEDLASERKFYASNPAMQKMMELNLKKGAILDFVRQATEKGSLLENWVFEGVLDRGEVEQLENDGNMLIKVPRQFVSNTVVYTQPDYFCWRSLIPVPKYIVG